MNIRNVGSIILLLVLLSAPLAGVLVGKAGAPGENEREIEGMTARGEVEDSRGMEGVDVGEESRGDGGRVGK